MSVKVNYFNNQLKLYKLFNVKCALFNVYKNITHAPIYKQSITNVFFIILPRNSILSYHLVCLEKF